jgi:hypothetical protein
MDFTRALIIVGLALGLVVVINLGLYLLLTRKNTFFEIDLFRKAAGRARQPWQSEDDALEELSERVKHLKPRPEPGASPPQEPPHE